MVKFGKYIILLKVGQINSHNHYMPKKLMTSLLFLIAVMIQNNAHTKPISSIKHDRMLKVRYSNADNGEGAEIFTYYCMSCHQVDGSGVPGMYPPLQKSNWVNGDKIKLIKILLNGLEGEIEVNGEIYSQVMPKQDYLTDHQIAAVLSYVRQNLGNQSDSIAVKDVLVLRVKH